MSSDDISENIRQRSQWVRIFFMLAFTVALYVTAVVLLVLVIAQALFALLSGRDNLNLRRLGANLTAYVSEILAFLTYNSEHRPFPIGPFPWLDDDDMEGSGKGAGEHGSERRREPVLLAAPRHDEPADDDKNEEDYRSGGGSSST